MAAENEVEVVVRVRDLTKVGLASARKGVQGLAKGLTALGSAGGALGAVQGVAAALSTLAPAALALPGALLGGAAAMATFKVATAGFGEALKNLGDPAKFAEAIKDMAPAAQETARAFQALQPQAKELRQAVQGAFFEGFAQHVRDLGGTYLPILKQGMTGIAQGFNGMGTAAAEYLQTAHATSAVQAILDNTSLALGNMRDSLGNVTAGFLGLGSIGSTYLPQLGSAIDSVTAKFADWVAANPEKIKAMIDGAIAGFQQLGGILGNVGSIISSVFSGMGGSMASPLASIEQLTARIAEFFKTVEAQTALQALGETLRVVSGVVGDVLLAALQALMPIFTALAPVIQTLAQSVGTLLVGALTALGPPLAQAVGVLAGALQPVLPLIADALVQMVTALAPLLPLFAELIAAVTPLIPPILQLAVAVFPAFVAAARAILPILTAVAGFLVEVLGGAITFIAGHISTFVSNSSAAWSAIKSGAATAFNWFASLPAKFSAWFEGARNAVVTRGQAMLAFIRDIPRMILSVLGNLGSLLVNSGRSLVDGFLRGIQSTWDRAVAWVRNAMGRLRALWPFSPAKEGPFSGSGYVTHSGKALTEDFAASLRAGTGKVQSAAEGVLGAAQLGGRPGGSGASAGVSAAAVGGSAGRAAGGAGVVSFSGNLDGAFATAFMRLYREGKIQIAVG